MLKFYLTKVWKAPMIVLLTGAVIGDAFSQHFASAHAPARRELQTIAEPQLKTNQIITLKEALATLKKRYHLKFAYRAGLLDGKKVSAEWLEEELSPELILANLLSRCELRYKQITKRQYSIVSKKDYTLINEVDLPLKAPEVVASEDVIVVVSGRVTSATDSAALPGVNVVLKGTSTGTTTDSNGQYSLSLPDNGGVLVFSFIGYTSQEISVTTQSTLNVAMTEDIQSLSEVVVTALGIAKEKKSLAYSVSEVKGEEFTQARENNVANALTGKIAGVNATGMATGPGGSSRVIIRGNGSLSGNNQPLYVINGMPMDNSVPGGSNESTGLGNSVDRGDGIGGINPDDIESISVLKGGPAAALYGARASNGVILITTKKGKAQKGVGIEYNTNFTVEDIALIPDWQYEYGQGTDGVKPTTQTQAKSSGRLSYGAKMDGEPSIQFDGQLRPYSPQKNNLRNFYRTGTNYINSIAFTGGNESLNFRFGLNNTSANSIVPNSSFTRRIANLNVNAKLGEKLSIETVVQYNIEDGNNRPKVGYADMNPHWATYLVANTVDIRSLAPGYDPVTGKEVEWNPVPAAPNPYMVINKFKNSDRKNRFLGQANIRYDLTDKLFIKGSASQDYYNFQSEFVQPTGNAFAPLGTYESRRVISSETNGMLTLNYNNDFFENISFSAMVGGNMQRSIYDQTAIDGAEFTIPYFYSYTNLATTTTIPKYQKSGINSIFGSADIGYKGIVYLTMSGRQDWFSVLNKSSNSIFYPAIGGTLILSDALELPRVISFAKLRASWAQVGGATVAPYQIYQTYSMLQGGHNGRPVQQLTQVTGALGAVVPNPDLQPLTSTTYEAGIEAGFFDNRLGFDLTLYNRKTTDDIVQSNIAASSGYISALLNVGELSNKGVELLITGKPINAANFQWDVSYNVAYNRSRVVKLADGIDNLTVGDGVGGGTIRNVVGGTYGEVWGYRKSTDANGEVVFNTASGYAVRGPLEKIGDGIPPLTMGITNTFKYKNFSLNVLIDGKFGSVVYSNLYQYAYRFGLPKETLPGRETGITVTGVNSSGDSFSKTWTQAEVDTYYDNDKNYTAIFTFNNDFVKLRQVILTYNIPVQKLSAFKWLQAASISFVGRNLLLLYKDSKNDYFDPESSYTNGNAQGLEAFGVPRTRSLGANLMVKF